MAADAGGSATAQTGSIADFPGRPPPPSRSPRRRRSTATCWAIRRGQQAPPIDGFRQEQPDEGQPASERTEVRVVFTADTLYIGVGLLRPRSVGIIVSDSRRDAPLDDTDSFQIIFDTYRDRQNGFVFGTNPAGIEYDGQVTNEGQGGGGLGGGNGSSPGSGGGFNLNWDGAWEVRAKITEHRLDAPSSRFRSARCAIPPATAQTWGVNFQRNIRRRNERAYWAPIPRQFNLYRLSLAGTLSGLQTPALRNFKVTPYVLGNALDSPASAPVDTEADGDVGGDVKYSLTPSLTLDAHLQHRLRAGRGRRSAGQPRSLQRCSSPRSGRSSSRTPASSRSATPARSTCSSAAASASATTARRFRSSAAAACRARPARSTSACSTCRPTTYDEHRAEQQLHASPASAATCRTARRSAASSSTAAAPAICAGDDDYNRTYALDGKWGIGQNTVLSGFVAQTETPGVDDDDYAFNLRSRDQSCRSCDLDVGYQEVGDGFNPEVGFLTRRGYRKPDVRVMTRFRPKDFLNLQELRPHVDRTAASGASTASRRPATRTSTTTGSSGTATRSTPA